MKQFLTIILAMLLANIAAWAQDEAMAVLTHNGTTKTFSGREALIKAYAEATHGDLITLSSGQFESVAKIEKAITIRGAGLGNDTVYHTQPTVIYNNMTLAIPNEVTGHFQMEGIYHANWIYYANNLTDAKFVRCRLHDISAGQYEITGGEKKWGTCQNMQFFHCKIRGVLVCNSYSTMSLVNCYVESPYTYGSTTSNISFRNCVIKASYKNFSAMGKNDFAYSYYSGNTSCCLWSCYLTNCIVYKGDNNTSRWNDNTVFTKCLLPSNWAPNVDRNTYQTYSSVTAIFQTYNGTYSETENFALKDDAAAAYLGNDGKQVGMYGGVIPYSPRLAGPHIKSLKVSDHSTADGKLNVKVLIESTQD